MIAEKTADAIRGRKLTPFEPPTRLAANVYPASASAPIYPPANPHESLAYASSQPQVYHHHAVQPQPLHADQWARAADHLDQLVASASSNSSSATPSDWSYDHFLSEQQRSDSAATAAARLDLLADRYAQSSVAETLMKSMHQPSVASVEAAKKS